MKQSTQKIGRWVALCGVLGGALLLSFPLRADPWRDLQRAGWQSKPIPPREVQVIDGDTFYVDWNRNGYTESYEKIRLLFVDTPELQESHKGQDLEFGLPAKEFLAERLKSGPLKLWVSPSFAQDRYQRTLGVVQAETANVNLLLIGLGHAPFDARYQHPEDFDEYTAAEARAFEERRGIWSTTSSRRHYLKRLAKEGRTVYSSRNRRFVSKLQKAERLNLSRYKDRFVQLEGTLERRERRGSYIELLFLSPQTEVVVHQRDQAKLPRWNLGDRIRVEGFVQQYRGRWQVRLFRGVP